MEPELFHMSYRTEFLQLFDTFMTSTHLTEYIVAAFVKKLARISLIVSAPSIGYILTMIHNLLYRHPQIKFLIHDDSRVNKFLSRKQKEESSALLLNNNTPPEDTFNYACKTTKESGAMNTSLWELEQLKTHYNATVATMATELQTKLQQNAIPLPVKEFIEKEYQQLIDEEMKQEGKVEIEFRKQDKLIDTDTEQVFELFVMQ
jgi:U3 small nucleolar RNA-associated protein 19